MLMLFLTLRLVTTTLGLSGLLVATAVPAHAQPQLQAKAKSEGAFVLYVGGPGGFSNVLDKKIDQQLSEDKLEVDASIFQTLQGFVRWKAEGQLLNYKPQGFDSIDASFKDPDGAFYGIMVIAMPYMINTEHVSSADVPDSALDFLRPQFRGKAV